MNHQIDSLNKVLASFKIDAVCIGSKEHRHFAFYDLELRPGCRINKLKNFSREIALLLRVKSTPIIRSIPERGVVRLQVTHRTPDILPFHEMYRAESRPTGLVPFLLGETDEGEKMWVEMSRNPHLLVAGTTGSGKSVLLHNLIANASQFDDVTLFLVDTKRVEFQLYEDSQIKDLIPFVAKDYDSALNVLEHLCSVMDQRYRSLAAMGLASIDQKPNIFSKIFVIVDEVADLMMLDRSGRFESLVSRLAAKSRACGIYLVLATQRPSVDVITGVIKANFSGRLACKVSSRVDSQVIMDHPGAEDLIGCGDAIFKNSFRDTTRLQIAYVTPQEVIADYVSRNSFMIE